MKTHDKKLLISGLFVLFLSIFIFHSTANALQFQLDPSSLEMCVGCERTVKVNVTGAVNLVSMGVLVSFDPNVLQVVDASKYEEFADGWIMDADGNSGTTDDQYTSPAVEVDNVNGTVLMIGGRIIGENTVGLSGTVSLGEIVFEAIADGDSSLNVDLGKYHPNDPVDTFDNFVRIDKTVDEPANAGIDLGSICVKITGDANGDGFVNIVDKVIVRNCFGQPGSGDCEDADVNCDGVVNIVDKVIVRNQFGESGGNACPD